MRTRLLTESSLIVNWLTQDLGRISTVAKGARRPKSPFLGKIDLFFECELSYQRSRRSDLHTLREVRLIHSFPALRMDIDCLRSAADCAKLIEKFTETETPLDEHFQLFKDLLHFLADNAPPALAITVFKLKFLTEQGLSPDFTKSRLENETVHILKQIQLEDWHAIKKIPFTRNQELEIQHFLKCFFQTHLGFAQQ